MIEAPVIIFGSVLSDAGCAREVNEDCGVCIHPGDGELLSAKGVLAIVADGMGGHSAGEVASRVAIEAIGSYYYETNASCKEALTEAFRYANRRIYAHAQEQAGLNGMGTTCTAIALRQGLAYCAHVGDSRLYLIRDGQIYVMTETHSAVMEKVRLGLITLDEARRHEDRNIILRSLGSRPEVDIAVWEEPFAFREGDCFVLCSDGLYDVVSDTDIASAVDHAEPSRACEQLISLARTRGAPDNVTAIVLSVMRAPESDFGQPPQTRGAGALA